MVAHAAQPSGNVLYGDDTSLVDLLDRLMAGGVVIAGDVVFSLAGIDLVSLRLQVALHSIDPSSVASALESSGLRAPTPDGSALDDSPVDEESA